MKKKLLVCGATGFIGRNVAEFFAEQDQYEVYGTYCHSMPLEHPRIRMVETDLTDDVETRECVKGMDILIQAAATTSGAKDIIHSPAYHVTDNALMNAQIFRAAFEAQVSHVLFFSCTTMYPSSDLPLKETDFDANARIRDCYFGGAWTKVYNEKMCEFFSRQGKTRFTVARHSNIYGPYDKYDLERSHVFGATVTKVETAAPGDTIVVWGDGGQGRDLMYVEDLMAFVAAALDRQYVPFDLFNVGCGHTISVTELVRKLIDTSGKDLNVAFDKTKPTINTSLCLDVTKAYTLLGWQPKVSLDEGIKKTIQWYRHHHEGVDC